MNYKMKNTTQEEKCTTCTAYHVFTSLLAEGLTLEDAFHVVLDEVIEELYEDGFQVGFVSALENVRGNLDNHIGMIIGTCDCDGCCEGE